MNIEQLTKKMLRQNGGELPGEWTVEHSKGQLRNSEARKKSLRKLKKDQRKKRLKDERRENEIKRQV